MSSDRTSHPSKFFSAAEKQQIIAAIQQAEKETSGEIRLHLERRVKKDIYHRAIKVFNKIGMDRTALKNGVLVYLATANKKFVILGDKGINDIVPENFWNDVAEQMSVHFASGNFCRGVCEGIRMIGEKLKTHFPYQSQDKNELSDQISIQDN